VRHPSAIIHNEVFYDKSKNFLVKALSVVKPFIDHTQESSRINFSRLILSHQKDIENIPEFKQCTDLMKNDPDISRHIGKLVGVKHTLSSASSWDYLRRMLSGLTRSYHEKKKFDERLFRKMYCDMETLFYGKTIPMAIFIPLQNFESDISYAKLDNHLCIRSITCTERQQYLLDHLEHLKLTFGEAIQIKQIVEYRFEENKVFDEPPIIDTSRTDTIKKVITSLRWPWSLHKCNLFQCFLESSIDLIS
jgi:hypothetical protein